MHPADVVCGEHAFAVGYGDLQPTRDITRVAIMVYAVACIGIVGYAFERLQRVMVGDIEAAVFKALVTLSEQAMGTKDPLQAKRSVCGVSP
jgi:hypothetical protein